MSPDTFTILTVDDEEPIRRTFKVLLKEYRLRQASSVTEARKILEREQVQLVLLDLSFPGEQGMDFLPEVRRLYPETDVIVVTSNGSATSGVKALKLGALDYMIKPFDKDEVRGKVQRLFEEERSRRRIAAYEQGEDSEARPLIGESPQIERVRQQIAKAATSDAPVLIQGESGTGKELVARAIHRQGGRRQNAFIGVNCGAFTATLVDSELFGHERGSFTGADRLRRGHFEIASGGTLFLDELCSLALEAQAKILRAIEEKTVIRVGGEKEVCVDPRIVAATNRDVHELVRVGKLREDLFYRLNVIPIAIPPLRERGKDILLLANHFLRRFAGKYGKDLRGFSPDLELALQMHAWKGNVRELENLVHRLAVDCDGPFLSGPVATRPEGTSSASAFIPSTNIPLGDAEDAFRRAYVRTIVDRFGGDAKQAAKALDTHCATVYRILQNEPERSARHEEPRSLPPMPQAP